MRPTFLIPLALTLFSSSCLENEEELEVRPDGSLVVTVTARGDAVDLASGYAVPLAGPWEPLGADTRLWTSVVGADTGSRAVAQAAEGGVWERAVNDPERDPELRARAAFASVDELPPFFAPVLEPYADAYLERSAALSIETKGDRTVYVFERRFHSRAAHARSVDEKARAALSDELVAKLDAGGPFSRGDKLTICIAYRAATIDALERIARSALADLYALGDASLGLERFESTCARVRSALESQLTVERLVAVWDELERRAELHEQQDAPGSPAADGENPLEELERELRDTLRAELGALAADGVAQGIVNGVLFRLERLFTALDHTDDLRDETFRVTVHMPGAVVDGNFDDRDGSTVVYEFKGERLAAGDVVLRVVSVVE